MKLSRIREKTDPSGIFAGEHKPVLGVRSLPVPLVDGQIHGLCVAEAIHEKDHLGLFDFLLLIDGFLGVFNGSSAFSPVFLFVPYLG